jgi:hypothetical protein
VVATRPKGLLNIPAQEPPGPDAFDTRPHKIKNWLRELPMGNPAECAKQVYHALRETNRLEVTVKDRLQMLEMLTHPIEDITGNLERHFANLNLPIAEKNQKIAALCIELYSELALGYKILIDQTWEKQLNFLNKKTTVGEIYRAMFHLYQILLTCYEIYIDPPANTWMHIHQLYLYAEDNQLTDVLPRNIDPEGPVPRATIGDLYIQIVLLGLLSPFRLRQSETKKVVTALREWSKLCKILSAEQFEEITGHVLIKQNLDYAPGFYFPDNTVNHVYTRTLDTTELVDHISNLVVTQPTRVEQNTRIYDLPPNVVKLLILTWSGKSKRLFSRTTKNNELTLSIGINATHFMISNVQKHHPVLAEKGPFANLVKSLIAADDMPDFGELQEKDDSRFDSGAQFDASPVFGVSNINNASTDVWDQDFGSKALGDRYNLKIWQQSKGKDPEKPYHPVHCDNVNESATGYCLFSDLKHESNPTKVQIGELIGIRNDKDKNDDIIDIGIIRRLKSTDKGIELGIQKMAPQADAIAVCLYHKKNTQLKYQRALLLPTMKQLNQPLTVAVSKTFRTGDELLVNKLGFKLKIQLAKLVETTAEFSQFEFDVQKTIGIEPAKSSLETGEWNDPDAAWTLI